MTILETSSYLPLEIRNRSSSSLSNFMFITVCLRRGCSLVVDNNEAFSENSAQLDIDGWKANCSKRHFICDINLYTHSESHRKKVMYRRNFRSISFSSVRRYIFHNLFMFSKTHPRVYHYTALYHSNIPKLLTFTNISTYPKIHQHLPFNTLSSTFLVNIQLEIKMEAYTEHNTICIK